MGEVLVLCVFGIDKFNGFVDEALKGYQAQRTREGGGIVEIVTCILGIICICVLSLTFMGMLMAIFNIEALVENIHDKICVKGGDEDD